MLHVDINQLLADPLTHGPYSKYEIIDTATGEHFVGKITLEFEVHPFKVQYSHHSVILRSSYSMSMSNIYIYIFSY